MKVVRFAVLAVILTAFCSLVDTATVIRPTALDFPVSGGDGIVSVQHQKDGSSTVRSTVDWAHATGVTQIGTQRFVTFTVESNDGAAREGDILIGDAVLHVTQDGLGSSSGSNVEPKRRFLAYCEPADHFDIYGDVPTIIDLDTEPPETGWILPPLQGTSRLYGVIAFADQSNIRVVADVLSEAEYTLIFAFGADRDFSDNPVYQGADGYGVDPVHFTITYSDGQEEPYGINPYFFTDRRSLYYFAESLRVGQITLGGHPYLIALQDEDADGLYSDDVSIGIVDAELYRTRDEPLTWLARTEPIEVEGTYYVIDRIAEDGTYLSVRAPGTGFVTGSVVSETGEAIRGATVTLDGEFSTTTYSDGWFALQVPAGDYEWLLVSASGFVPEWSRITVPSHYPEQMRAMSELVTPERDVERAVVLRRPQTSTQGRVTVQDNESYHCLSGDRGDPFDVLGDFRVRLYGEDGPSLMANTPHQRGLVSLGAINGDLCDLTAPTAGYSRFGVAAIVGHTYVSLAREGEEGHYVFLRVVAISAAGIVLDYCYR